MARIYRQNTATRVTNWVFTTLTRAGMGASYPSPTDGARTKDRDRPVYRYR